MAGTGEIKGAVMPAWVRNAVMLAVCGVWAIGVTLTLLHGATPSAVVWAVPGATYALLTGGTSSIVGGFKRVHIEVDDGEPPKPVSKT